MHTLANFFVLEGSDACGKSTLMRQLKSKLGEENYFFTQEPYTHELTPIIRAILRGKTDSPLYRMEAHITHTGIERAMESLFVADRYLHLLGAGGILHKIEQGFSVICDRYFFSTLAYQYLYRGLSQETIYAYFHDFSLPRIIFYLNPLPDIHNQRSYLLQRMANKEIHEGKKTEIFEKKIYQDLPQLLLRYETIFNEYQKIPQTTLITLDARANIETNTQIILKELAKIKR